MKTQNGPPMTAHTKATIPAMMDAVVTDRMGLDLGINQEQRTRLYHHFPVTLATSVSR